MIPAIFDIDRTLIEGMSGGYFVRYLWRQNVYGVIAKLRIVRGLYLHRINLLTEADIVNLGATSYRGIKADELKRWGERCFEEVVKEKIFADAFREVKKHIRQGHHVVFASGSSNYIAEPIGRYFGAHRTIGTRAAVLFGKSTDKIDGHLCYGEGKLRLVEKHLRSIGLGLSEAYFYSDGLADLPLLERVRYKVAVNPSIELEEIAIERGWPVLRWQDYLKGK